MDPEIKELCGEEGSEKLRKERKCIQGSASQELPARTAGTQSSTLHLRKLILEM